MSILYGYTSYKNKSFSYFFKCWHCKFTRMSYSVSLPISGSLCMEGQSLCEVLREVTEALTGTEGGLSSGEPTGNRAVRGESQAQEGHRWKTCKTKSGSFVILLNNPIPTPSPPRNAKRKFSFENLKSWH